MDAPTYLSMTYEDKIALMTQKPDEMDLPEEAAYLAQYLAQYRPLLPPAAHLDNETSAEIADTMVSTCVIDINTVSRVMRMLGYQLHIQGVSAPTWAMCHIDDSRIID